MRILVPTTRKPLYASGNVVYIDPLDNEAYWRFWRDTWKAQMTVIVVEHDVIPSRLSLQDLWNCPMGWCTQPYNYLRVQHYRGLGCVKFSSQLMQLIPDLWEMVAYMRDDDHPAKHWCRLNEWSQQILDEHLVTRHDHHLKVRHPIHERSAHGCR